MPSPFVHCRRRPHDGVSCTCSVRKRGVMCGADEFLLSSFVRAFFLPVLDTFVGGRTAWVVSVHASSFIPSPPPCVKSPGAPAAPLVLPLPGSGLARAGSAEGAHGERNFMCVSLWCEWGERAGRDGESRLHSNACARSYLSARSPPLPHLVAGSKTKRGQ